MGTILIDNMEKEDQSLIDQTALLEQAIFPDPWSAKEIKSTLEQKGTICAVASLDGKVVGYYLCYSVLDECEIARIAVDESVRRMGIGNQLFDFLKERCKEKEITKILLDVRKSNLPAIHFYEKNGFLTDGIRKNYYGGAHPEDAVLMSKVVE